MFNFSEIFEEDIFFETVSYFHQDVLQVVCAGRDYLNHIIWSPASSKNALTVDATNNVDLPYAFRNGEGVVILKISFGDFERKISSPYSILKKIYMENLLTSTMPLLKKLKHVSSKILVFPFLVVFLLRI
jgi:hypothetical protein